MIEPIHTSTLNGQPVRFFKSSLDRPDFPWHAAEDLNAAGKLPRVMRRQFMHGLFKDWRREIKQAVVDGELITLAPHFVGEVMAEIIDGCHPGFHGAYIKAAIAAVNVVTAGMPPAEQIAYMLAAHKGGSGME